MQLPLALKQSCKILPEKDKKKRNRISIFNQIWKKKLYQQSKWKANNNIVTRKLCQPLWQKQNLESLSKWLIECYRSPFIEPLRFRTRLLELSCVPALGSSHCQTFTLRLFLKSSEDNVSTFESGSSGSEFCWVMESGFPPEKNTIHLLIWFHLSTSWGTWKEPLSFNCLPVADGGSSFRKSWSRRGGSSG